MSCEIQGETPISTDSTFTDCVVLDKETFDPDAVFMDDIVDDEVLPRLSLAVDGLTDTITASKAELELAGAANEADTVHASTHLPESSYDPAELDVYGWESSWWRKIRGYLGF